MLLNSFHTAFGLTDIHNYLDLVETQANWLQWIIYIVAVILILVGFFAFIKKFIKAFLVIAILGGGLYYLYTQTTVLDSIKDLISGFGLYITNIF